MLKRLKSLERGQIFSAGGFNWLVVEHNQHGTLALMEKCLKDAAFDEENSNDWRQSSSRRYLNENFLQVIEDNGLGPDNIIETEVDLTADDGLKDYGTSIDKVFLLTADMYRKNRDVIEPIDDWWWLITPYSTPTAGDAHNVRFVHSGGSLSYSYACNGRRGLRPALISEIGHLGIHRRRPREHRGRRNHRRRYRTDSRLLRKTCKICRNNYRAANQHGGERSQRERRRRMEKLNPLGSLFKDHSSIVLFDVETTGLDSENCEIIELAALKLKSNTHGSPRIDQKLELFIKLPEGQKIPEKITELTGITDEKLQREGISRTGAATYSRPC